MSVVTNVMVSGGADRETWLKVAADLGLLSLTPCPADGYEVNWGGSKMPECDIWAGAFNHLDLEEFLGKVATYPWWRVEVFVKGEYDELFQVYRLKDGQFELALDGVDMAHERFRGK